MYDSFCALGVDITEFDSSILKLFESAQSCGCLNDDLAYQYVSYYLQIGKVDEARELAEKLCCGVLSKGPRLWSLRISIEMKGFVSGSIALATAQLNHIYDLFKLATSQVSISETETLWQEV